MYALSISDSNFCRGEETSDLGVVGERMAVIMRRKFVQGLETTLAVQNAWDHDHSADPGNTSQRRQARVQATPPSFLYLQNVFGDFSRCLSLQHVVHPFKRRGRGLPIRFELRHSAWHPNESALPASTQDAQNLNDVQQWVRATRAFPKADICLP